MCMMCMTMHAMDHAGHGTETMPSSAPQSESLLDVLKRRYALGEITREQFDEMRRVLNLDAADSSAEHARH